MTVEQEMWRPTKYTGYEVSNFGRIRSYWSPRGFRPDLDPRIKSTIVNNGRAKVGVHTGKKNSLVLLNRLVAEAFLGKPRNRVVLFRDNNPINCSADNLYYATRKEAGEQLTQRRYQANGDDSSLGRKLAAKKIRQKNLDRALRIESLRGEGLTYREIGNLVGMSESGVCRVFKGLNNRMLEKAKGE